MRELELKEKVKKICRNKFFLKHNTPFISNYIKRKLFRNLNNFVDENVLERINKIDNNYATQDKDYKFTV